LPNVVVKDGPGEVGPIVVMGVIPEDRVEKKIGRCGDVVGEVSIDIRLDRSSRSNWRGSNGDGSIGGSIGGCKVGIGDVVIIIKGGE
jgi:hypothetical protein